MAQNTNPVTLSQPAFSQRFLRALLLIVALLLVAYLTLPFVAQCLYTVPSADDFLNNADSGRPSLRAALQGMVNLYMGWQGTYFGAFLGTLIVPFQTGGMTGVHVALTVITVLFIVTFYDMALCLLALVTEKPLSFGARLLIACGVFGVMTLAANSSDTFTWLSSTWVYTIPLSLLFLGVSFLCRAVLHKKTVFAIIAGILLFLASGGTLPVASLGCLLSIAGVLLALGTKSSVKYPLIAFLPALLGALLNTFAPGNFVRHALITSDYRVLHSLLSSASTVIGRLLMLLTETPAALIFLLLLVLSANWTFSERMRRACTLPMLLCLLVCLPALILIPFPMILGYDGDMALRGYVVLNVGVALWLTTLAVYLGCWMQQKTALRFRPEERILTIALAACLFFFAGGADKLLSSQQSTILSQLASGQYAAFLADRTRVLSEIADSPDANVTVTQYVLAPTYIRDVGLIDYAESFSNTSVASYYGKESVVCLYEAPAD